MAKKRQITRKRDAAQRKYQVFVSHATADKWLASTLCDKIEAVGASTFRDDRDINGGELNERLKQ